MEDFLNVIIIILLLLIGGGIGFLLKCYLDKKWEIFYENVWERR